MRRRIFITGIGTEVGKTVVSALFVKALGAAYWKPVQCGMEEGGDTAKIYELTLAPSGTCLVPGHEFLLPASPHAAAKAEGRTISLETLTSRTLPENLIIEGAGGVLVPLNGQDSIIDLATAFDCQVVVVVRSYLGCINHTLLTVQELKRRKLRILGLVFSGLLPVDSKEVILARTGLPCLYELGELGRIGSDDISFHAPALKRSLDALDPA